MSKICLCLTGKTIARDLEAIERYRPYIDAAELRVDCLDEDELAFIRGFPVLAGIPVILTVRRKTDGGCFVRGEGARIVLLSKALAFAHPDARRNFAYVDMEDDLDAPGLEEVARTYRTRIIRSFHCFDGGFADLVPRMRSLYRVGDEIAKAAVTPQGLDDVCTLFEAAQELKEKEKILIAMGDMGQCTRLLAARLGSALTYAAVKNEEGFHNLSLGQTDPQELCDAFHFRGIDDDTEVYGIAGYPLQSTGSPPFYNGIFHQEKMNKVYIRFPADTIESFLKLASIIPLAGASITVPHKESVLHYLHSASDEVKSVGACNTIVRTPEGWSGYNTDTQGFQESLLNLLHKKNLRWKRCTVIGSGGAARAICSVISRLRGKALVLNRDAYRAKQLATRYRFEYGALDEKGAQRARSFSDVVIQTSSVGMEPDLNGDPLPHYQFSGKEAVIDIVYKPARTAFLKRALAAGCLAINGEDMLFRQAVAQYKHLVGVDCPLSAATAAADKSP
ncbi:MAG: type I 3-dehydroquinate dehydratase [Spirochaetaceae bacterium]|jgi:3-dehydroquinate dehydratase/shikimate dehydrogenase|nr:type I 3-dehydroquinate dehydratase [Spirochaetaceae bacterium]